MTLHSALMQLTKTIFNMQTTKEKRVLEVSQSPFLGKVTQATKVKMSRNYLCRLGSKMQARTHNDAPMASKSQIKDIQYKYYKYKNMMEKLQARVFAELSKNCEFDPAKQEVKLNKSCFQQMTDKFY